MFCIVVVDGKQDACVPRENGGYLHMCPGGRKGALVLVVVVEGETVEWEEKLKGMRIKP